MYAAIGSTVYRPKVVAFGCALFAAALLTRPLSAQHGQDAAPSHTHDQEHSHGLHFTHPLIAESVSPDTKVRVDYAHRTPADQGELEFEGEYAFHRAFSIEVGVPTVSRDFAAGETDFGPEHVHAALKFANYAFEAQGVLLGYGFELGLPVGEGHAEEPGGHAEEEPGGPEGHTHGDDIYEFAPFLNAGLMVGDWELVGFGIFSIPTNQDHQENVSTDFKYNASALYHATPRIQALLELNGGAGLSGPAVGRDAAYLTPGLRVLPLADRPLAVGLGLSVPLADDRDFDTRTMMSVFYHF